MNLRRVLLFLAAISSIVGIKRYLFPAVSSNHQDALLHNLATPQEAPIPKEALRLRIIANSNSPKDQSVKLQVRNAIVMKVAKLLQGTQTQSEAKRILKQNTASLEQIAVNIVRQKGQEYPVQTEVAKVPFPTKVYGNKVYPAGDYEALRIVLGNGKGANWWCVVFPPLCFIDIAEGDAVANSKGFPDTPPLETIQIAGPQGKSTKVQVRMLSLDLGEEIWHAVENRL